MVPWLREENFVNNIAVVDQISNIAEKKGVTTAQLTLAWLLAQGEDIFPIPGTKKVHRLEENLASMSVVLTPEEEGAVRKAADGIVGGRVQDLLGHTFADTPPLP
jgi:aryl-alcohol dehydrogenase-like predicted oxidoreductase